MQFQDIEMLDIPESDVSATESPSRSATPPAVNKDYPSLQEWLSGEKDLEFQFSAAAYKASVANQDEEPQSHYINKLYKVIEETMGPGNIEAQDLGTSGPLGLVSSSRQFEAPRIPKHAVTAFKAVLGAYMHYYGAVVDTLDAGDARDLTALVAILNCLHASTFYGSELTRPELTLEWINSYDPKPENAFISSVMYDTKTPWKHPQFWTSYMGTLLSRGMFGTAAESIAASKYAELKSDTPGLYEIIEDLGTLVGAYAGMAGKGQFAQWKSNVCEFRDNFGPLKEGLEDMVHVTVASQIHDLLCLMSGMPKTTASFVSSWYEMYGCLCLFQVRDDESVYTDYFRLAVAEKGYNVAEPVEETFRDILSGNYLRVILAVDQCDSPTAAYLSKIFDACGFFSNLYRDVGSSAEAELAFGDQADAKAGGRPDRQVSDYLLVRHAFACLESHRLVPVGLGLLVQPLVQYAQARDVVARFLPQYSYQTNDDLEWALTICAKLDLPAVGKQLFEKQGSASLRQGHIFEALNMLVKAFDETANTEADAAALAQIHTIVWEDLFQDALLNSLPVPDELIANVVTNRVAPEFPVHPVIRQCLAPYAVLCEYLAAVSDAGQFSRCLSDLFHLIRFKYLPQKYVPLLLAQFLPFFRDRQFELPQLVIMIELIDTFETSQLSPEDEQLYVFATENIPEDAPWDWRVQVQQQDKELPKSVPALVKELRNCIVRSIGEVYITM